MPRYLMSQKLLAFGDDFTIQDDAGRDVFFVDGKALSVGDKLSFQDMQGRELARIEQKVLSLAPTYLVFRGEREVATVKKELFTFLKARFEVDVPGPDDLTAEGNLFDHEYTFTRGGQTVARVSKAWVSLRDRYGIEIAEGEDDIVILAAAVVIDLVRHDQED